MSGDEAAIFARAERVFAESLAQPIGEQRAFVERACEGEPALLELVLSLLAADATADVRLDEAIVPGEAIAEKPPERIAGFRIAGVLGEGGMGVVYDAEQESPKRRVALKVIRAGSMGRGAIRRFGFECEVLARLDHPGIATVFESGTAEIGGAVRPYFAMELVRGRPITDAVIERTMSTAGRLGLIAAVADAVHHAHTRGVIHRDLKPGNVLVTEDGRVKVLDFGVARAMDSETQRQSLMTREGQVVGTPIYMSPEQISGDPTAIDARSDVYALGVLAYEVLTGKLPYSGEGGSIYAIAHAIREQTPTSMSAVDRSLRGDVETIVGKALEKEPERRYQSASELAADIRRYLDRQPIQARRPSTWYQAQRFASRNPGLVGAVGVAFVALVAALAVVTYALRETEAQRQAAERDRGVLGDINTFLLEDLMSLANPRSGGDRAISLVEAINTASDGISDRFADSPEVEAAIRGVMGEMHMTLDDYDRAVANLERAVMLAEEKGFESGDLVDHRNVLSQVYMDLGRQSDAQAVLRTNLEVLERELPNDHERRLDTMINLSHAIYKENTEDSILASRPIMEEAVAYGREHLPRSDGTLNALSSLALVYQRTGMPERAAEMYDEIISGTIERHGPTHPDTLTVRVNRAMLLTDLGRFEEAEAELIEVLGHRIDAVGEENVDTQVARSMLARNYMRWQRPEDAEPLLVEAVHGLERVLGPEHPYAAIGRRMLRNTYIELGRPEEAARYEDLVRAPPAGFVDGSPGDGEDAGDADD